MIYWKGRRVEHDTGKRWICNHDTMTEIYMNGVQSLRNFGIKKYGLIQISKHVEFILGFLPCIQLKTVVPLCFQLRLNPRVYVLLLGFMGLGNAGLL